jgi:ATP phosphoribosyltransferase
LRDRSDGLRIVTEYPNLAESFALRRRLRRFRIFSLWGAAESFPPENAELAIIADMSGDNLRRNGLARVETILEGSACLVANRDSLQSKDLGQLLSLLSGVQVEDSEDTDVDVRQQREAVDPDVDTSRVFLALPDGHQQPHTIDLLNRAGIAIDGYSPGTPSRRPRAELDGVTLKVIRPQDMPFQVANGNFDLAITGRDWLADHRARFPVSPVEELLDLGYGRVRIVAVVSNDLPVSNAGDLRRMARSAPLRVAAEYVNVADKYAHDRHLAPCKIIPTWGATEAFLPEDADVLIENTETGSTIAANNLKIVDTLFESTGCLIGNSESLSSRDKGDRMTRVVDMLSRGVEATPV